MNTLALPAPERPRDDHYTGLLPDILTVLFKWKWLILVCLLAVAIPVCMRTMQKPERYIVTAKILLKTSRAQMMLSPTPQRDAFYTWRLNPQVINAEIEVLKSLELIEKAAQEAGYLKEAEPDEQKMRRLRFFQDLVKARPVSDSNFIEITFEAFEPERGALFINALVTQYQERNSEIHGGGDKATVFFEQQAALYKAKVEKTGAQIGKFQSEHGVIGLRDEMEMLVREVTDLESQLAQMKTLIAGGEEEVATLETLIQQQPDQLSMRKTMSINPEIRNLQSDIISLENEHDKLLERFLPRHPAVIAKKNEINTLHQRLKEKEEYVLSDIVLSSNSVKDALLQQSLSKKAEIKALKAKEKVISQDVDIHKGRLVYLRDRLYELGLLRSEFDHARNTYSLYQQKAEEARISQAMDEEKIMNVEVIEKAFPPSQPVAQNLKKSLVLAVFSGLMLGIGGAFVLEFFNATIKNERDAERFLALPVLATIRSF
jgi:uncharacterized protein involved in exopolysaccharide biosynthesis